MCVCVCQSEKKVRGGAGTGLKYSVLIYMRWTFPSKTYSAAPSLQAGSTVCGESSSLSVRHRKL